MKNSNDTIGNRTRDLPACSAVPQPNVPPRAPTCRNTRRIVVGVSQYQKVATVLFFVIISSQQCLFER